MPLYRPASGSRTVCRSATCCCTTIGSCTITGVVVTTFCPLGPTLTVCVWPTTRGVNPTTTGARVTPVVIV